jgi:kynurenine formamidase
VLLVDLTRPLGFGTPVIPGDPAVTLRKVAGHESHGYEVTHICLGSHAGTHLDAPRHFFPDGATLSDYALERLVGTGVIIDVRPTAGLQTIPHAISADRIAEGLRSFPVEAGSRVLLWTGGRGFLSPEGARVLVDSQAGLVGMDSSGPDYEDHPAEAPGCVDTPRTSAGHDYPVHRLLLGAGLLIAENLCNLERLGAGPVQCAFLPLAVEGTDGAPVRAVAWR